MGELFQQGWIKPHSNCLGKLRHVPSPNFDDRPLGMPIDTLVLHYISLPANVMSGSCVEDFFCNRLDVGRHSDFEVLSGMRVSAHFFLRRNGALIQFVSCEQRAWHAGVSMLLGRERCNDFSIGIEIEGSSDIAFTNRQYARLQKLTQALCARYPLSYVVGHSDIAPDRKQDPGPFFDWQRFLKSVDIAPLSRPF